MSVADTAGGNTSANGTDIAITTSAQPTTGGHLFGTTSLETPSTDTGPSETTSNFIVVPDHPDSWCDLFAQDCPPGQKCSFFSEDLTHDNNPVQICVPLAPDPQPPDALCHFNEPGMGLDDCALGSYCMPYFSDGAGASVCVALCGGSLNAPICPDKHDCVIQDSPEYWCQFSCDPLLQDCADGLACDLGHCHPTSPGFFDRPPGSPCGDSPSPCAPMSTCAPAEFVPDCPEEYCCTQVCDLEAPDPCILPGQSCQPPDEHFQEFLPEGEGVCSLP
jgi:hypothetical protein